MYPWSVYGVRKRLQSILSLCAVVALFAGCGAGHAPAAIPTGESLQFRHKTVTLPKYVIVMVQENRTIDNLFQTQPGVDTQSYGYDSHDKRIPLKRIHLASKIDCDHSHLSFV